MRSALYAAQSDRQCQFPMKRESSVRMRPCMSTFRSIMQIQMKLFPMRLQAFCAGFCLQTYVCVFVLTSVFAFFLTCSAPPSGGSNGGSNGGVGQGPAPSATSGTPATRTSPVTTATSTVAVTTGDSTTSQSPGSGTAASGCFQPGIPQNGGRNGTTASGDTYAVNDIVQYRCETGYTRVGVEMRTCLPSGQWSGTLPRCEGEISQR